MSGLLFVSQAALVAWVERERVQLEHDVMAVPGDGGRRYTLVPAVRFLTLVGSDRDPHGLLSKVKSDAKLRALGAEWLGDSVVLGDVAYQVEPGFLAAAVEQACSAPTVGASGERADADPMARFLLKSLA
jgi:hypothetical protein